MRFTDQLWSSIAPTYEAILQHPFVNGLCDGSLSRERFVFYMKQDSLYLQEFSRALAIAGARASEIPVRLFFVNSSQTCLVVENALHETYFKEFGVVQDAQRAPTNFSYSNYLVATAATGPHAVALAALLPCFWIYREVGHELIERSRADLAKNPYARWIQTYASDEFDASVQKAIGFVDAAADRATESERTEMGAAFDRCARLEWAFWDAAWRLEQWPPYAVE
jgi:thiaminase/transcriptional activator TenA